MADKRKGLSKKIRFEIFKRDSFTCQYCGRKSPDVILNVDHISPVKEGGKNDIMNLITSCFDCNSGKKDRKLSDNSVIARQQKQLEELNERREQLEMMLKWREGLTNLIDDQVSNITTYLQTNMSGYAVAEPFKMQIKKWIKKYSIDAIYDAIDESASRYLQFVNGKATRDSISEYLDKIGGIAYFKSLPPLEQKINWLKIIANKAFNTVNWAFTEVLNEYVKALQGAGWSEERIIKDLQEEVRGLINRKHSARSFTEGLEKWISDIKKWNSDEPF